ncbi:ribose-phosphate pyrophosphokinase [Candidatus Woesearchaeota archaeon]|nr:ribose-phosphate pyrophosphokinase [Candidatus Woesearchaeota archaeon]
MGLRDIVIASLSRDPDSMNFPRKTVEYLHSVYKISIPEVEKSIYPGKFSGGEFNPEVFTDLTGKNVYLFGVPTDPANILHSVSPGEMKSRAEFSAYTAWEHGAKHITFVAPDLYFSRADKGPSDMPESSPEEKRRLFKGKGNLAKAQANAFKANHIDRVITMHLHSPWVAKSYQDVYGRDDALITMNPLPLIIHYFQHFSLIDYSDQGRNVVLVSPDKGAEPFARDLYSLMHDVGLVNVSLLMFDKLRLKPNDPNMLELSNPRATDNYQGLAGKIAITLDDMDDTVGTRERLHKTLKVDGVVIEGKSPQNPDAVVSYATHAVHAGLAYEDAQQRMAAAFPLEVLYMNTHPSIEKNMIYELRKVTSVIRTARYFGEVIRAIEEGIPLTEIYCTDGVYDPQKVAKFAEPPKRRTEHPRYTA